MKHLFSFVMAVLFSLSAHSAPYRLPFVESQGGFTKIPFVEKEWILGAGRDDWDLYVEKGMFDQHKDMHEFHAVTAYKTPYQSDGLRAKVSKIYTYGVLNCNRGVLDILYEWYVDIDENIIYTSSHEFGSYTVEMLTPDTARNEVYTQICKEMI